MPGRPGTGRSGPGRFAQQATAGRHQLLLSLGDPGLDLRHVRLAVAAHVWNVPALRCPSLFRAARPGEKDGACRVAEGMGTVTRYVIGPDVALRLARDEAVIPDEHHILAPTLLRSQVLSLLYQAVRSGEMTKKDADRLLNHVRGLRIRLLGDRVLQNVAWKVADQLGWDDTFAAEYIALTQLQADAFITLDGQLAQAVQELVTTASVEALS